MLHYMHIQYKAHVERGENLNPIRVGLFSRQQDPPVTTPQEVRAVLRQESHTNKAPATVVPSRLTVPPRCLFIQYIYIYICVYIFIYICICRRTKFTRAYGPVTT